MCYRCSICEANVGPRIGLNRHVIYRTVTKWPSTTPILEIERELPICGPCKTLLDQGFPLVKVRYIRLPKPSAAPINLPSSAPALQAEAIV